jgi:hypothetical protein
MSRPTLADTLTALAFGAAPQHPHLVVEEAEISLPLLVWIEAAPDGPCFYAQPPWSAFRSGVEPVPHRARLRLGTLAADPAASARPAPARAVPETRAAPESAG